MLKVSAFYLEKQKSFFPEKYYLGRRPRTRDGALLFQFSGKVLVKAMMANALTFTSCLVLSVRSCVRELHTKPEFEKKLMKTREEVIERGNLTCTVRTACFLPSNK